MSDKSLSKQEFSRLLEKYQQGKCTPAEKEIVLKWYNVIQKKDFPFSEQQRDALKDKIWIGIEKKSNDKKRSWIHVTPLKVAAAIAALVTVGALFILLPQLEKNTGSIAFHKLNNNEIKNDSDAERKIVLDDGSILVLAPNSIVQLADSFSIHRELTLIGEAFFDVKRDEEHPFVIHTNDVITKVLGTSFSIRALENQDSIIVSVKSGRVSVSKKSKKLMGLSAEIKEAAVLTPNQQIIYNSEVDEFAVSLIEKPEVVAKQEDLKIMEFEEVYVTEIIKALEAAYGVDINYEEEAMKSCRLTTRLINDNLYDRLDIICKAIGGTYETVGTTIQIVSNGCK